MSYKAIDVFGPNRLGRIRLEAPESRPSLLKIWVLPEQYYPIKESYNDASETRELCPPIQITGACSLTNGKCSRIPVQSCPKLVGEPRGGDPPPYLPLSRTQLGWGRASRPRGWGSGGVTWRSKGSRVSSTEILTEGRHRVPAQSLKLGETGLARSLADKRWLSQWSTDIAWSGGHCEGH